MRNYQLADKPGRTKNWRSEDSANKVFRTIYHYSTGMLTFGLDANGKWDGDMDNVNYSTGHGSVSDQQTMNQLFARLGMPLYFSRSGGAEIRELDKPQFRYGISA